MCDYRHVILYSLHAALIIPVSIVIVSCNVLKLSVTAQTATQN
jgi:hypothetical protein